MKKLNIFTIDKLYKRASKILVVMAILCVITILVSLFINIRIYRESKTNIFLLNDGEVYQLSLTKDVMATRLAEAKAQAMMLMQLLFNLSPDAYQINHNYTRLIELSGDRSLRTFYHSLEEEEKFFSRIIAENITQKILLDYKNIYVRPYKNGFLINAAGAVVITRPSTETEYNVTAEFYLRQSFRSSANGHGFLVENFKLTHISNKKTQKRFLTEITE